jgi:thymidylate synthase|tara:strand:+ start:47514 stop:48383 length:870 start_codon:yes stop_codon:yes gene_type:complete
MANWEEEEYLSLLQHVMDTGEKRDQERTGTGTRSIFYAHLNFQLEAGLPLLTTKKVNFKAILSELLWFLEGSSDERRLAEIHYGDKRENLIGKRTIWTDNADKQGKELGFTNTDTVKNLGPVYGVQWRNSNGVDQIAEIIKTIKENPQSRRHILNAWNPRDVDMMALPPCHTMSQFYVSNDRKLSCNMYQRSADLFLGVPFNIASYSLLTYMIAHVCKLGVGDFNHIFGDCHVYEDHFDAVKEQLERQAEHFPKLKINRTVESIDDFKIEDFELIGYDPQPFIKASMSV